MEPSEFINAMVTEVFESAVDETLGSLREVRGRKPPQSLVAASRWFNQLSESDRGMVEFVARCAAHASLFGALAVIDGVRVIDAVPHGEFRLTYLPVAGDEVRLNQPNLDLHDLFNGMVHPVHDPLVDP